MIPKVIHYCWFGGGPLPESVIKCIDSWQKHCPDYQIVQWNENNYDANKIPYTQEAYANKKYAFVSDYARLDIIYQYGGIYLDTDVELIKPLDELLVHDCYLGCELPGRVNTGLGFGAIKGHSFVKENMSQYEKINFKMNGMTCVDYTMVVLENKGYVKTNEVKMIDNISIFPTDYFCPFNMQTQKMNMTDHTFSIHHYDASWYTSNLVMRRIHKHLLPIKISLRTYIDKKFGKGKYDQIKKLFYGRHS